MEKIFYINLSILFIYIILLISDIYDTIYLLTLTSSFLLLSTSLYNKNNLNILLNTLSMPIIYLLLYLGILSNIFLSSRYLIYLTKFYQHITNKYLFMLLILIISCFLSGFLNNSLIVSFYIPIIESICRKKNWNYKLLYLSLSFVSMLGGTITTIGSSTNILAKDLLLPEIELNMWDLTPYSLVCCFFGILYLFFMCSFIKLNNITGCIFNQDPICIESKFYKISDNTSNLIKRTIKESEINSINGLQICGVKREDNFYAYPSRSFTHLELNDTLIYIGKINDPGEVTEKISNLGLFEVDNNSIIVPNLAIAKINNTKICNKCLSTLKTHYNLLLLGICKNNFILNRNLNNYKLIKNDYIIVHGLNGQQDMINNLNKICTKIILLSDTKNNFENNLYTDLSLFFAILFIIIGEYIPLLNIYLIALISIILFLLFNIVTLSSIVDAFNKFNTVIVGTGLSLLISKSLELSGVILFISEKIHFIKFLPKFTLFIICHLISSFLSIILSNASVVAVLIPIIKDIFLDNPLLKPVSLCIIHGASCCFASPTGYHTNLMIYNIGGYKCLDFLILGVPLHFLISLIFSGTLFLIY